MNPKFSIRTAITMPRNTRRVYCPVDGSNERVVSELIPVDAITESGPMIGMRYGDIDWINQPETNYFDDYKLRKIEPYQDLFSRLLFSRDIPANESKIPFKTTTSFEQKDWPTILYRLYFVAIKGVPISVRGPNGKWVFAKRWRPRMTIVPGGMYGTRVKREHFIHSEEPKLPNYPPFQTDDVRWDFLDTNGGVPDCLHDDLMIGSQAAAIPGFSTGDSTVATSIEGQFYPATNPPEWAPRVDSHTPTWRDGVWESVRETFLPPPLPELITQ